MALSFVDWFRKKYGIGVSSDLYFNDSYARAEYEKYLKSQNVSTYDSLIDQYNNGQINAIDMQGVLANNGIPTTPEQTQWINNAISQQVTQESRDYNTEMRDTSYTSAASQLGSLGLNPASVIQSGGAGIGNTGQVADISKANPAQEKALNSFNQKAAMTRTIIGLLGGLAGAGIYGSTRILASKAARAAADSMSHSGLEVIRRSTPREAAKSISEAKWNSILSELERSGY